MRKIFTEKEVEAIYNEAIEKNLYGCGFLKKLTIKEMADGFNGVGAEFLGDEIRGWISDILEIFLPAALIHDLRNEYSDGTRSGFWFANDEFRVNCIKLAKDEYGLLNWKRYAALIVAQMLFSFVSSESMGWRAWLEAKEEHERKATSGNGAGE